MNLSCEYWISTETNTGFEFGPKWGGVGQG